MYQNTNYTNSPTHTAKSGPPRLSNNGDKAISSGSDIWIFDEDPPLWVTIWWSCRWSTSINDGANERSCLSQASSSTRNIDFERHICSMGAQTAIRTSIYLSIYLSIYQRPKLWTQPCDYLMNVMQLRCDYDAHFRKILDMLYRAVRTDYPPYA